MRKPLDDLARAVELSGEMLGALRSGALEQLDQLAEERDKLLHQGFAEEVPSSDKEQVLAYASEIESLNNEMISLSRAQQEELAEVFRQEVAQTLNTSNAIRTYVDNMSRRD